MTSASSRRNADGREGARSGHQQPAGRLQQWSRVGWLGKSPLEPYLAPHLGADYRDARSGREEVGSAYWRPADLVHTWSLLGHGDLEFGEGQLGGEVDAWMEASHTAALAPARASGSSEVDERESEGLLGKQSAGAACGTI